MSNRARDFLNQFFEEDKAYCKSKHEKIDNFLKKLEKDVQPFLKAVQKYCKTHEVDAEALNIDLDQLKDPDNVVGKKTRQKKAAPLTENSANIEKLKIKAEKISGVSEPASSRTSIDSTSSSVIEVTKENIKEEKDEKMPAPNWIPPKKGAKEIKVERASTRSTRTKGKKAATKTVRDSDVVVQNTPITSITLSDTDSDIEKNEDISLRSTRQTKKATQSALDSGTETETESTRSTRTKTRTKKEEPNVEEAEESRSTRTKTLRKGKKAEEESAKVETEESQPEVRSTRTKTLRKAKEPEDTNEQNKLPDNNDKEDKQTESARSTRAKGKKVIEPAQEQEVSKESESCDMKGKGKSKRNRSDSTDEELVHSKESKKSKSHSPSQNPPGDTTAQTVYEDAQSTIGPTQKKQLDATFVSAKPVNQVKNAPVPPVPPLNTTVVIDNKVPIANSTMVVDHPKYNIFDKKSNNDMFTDDDSIEIKTPPEKNRPTKYSKEVFSPYEKTTLKKKVEAFEKLQNGSDIPVKTTKSIRDTPSSVKEKAKMFTPSGMRFQPSSSSTSKISRLLTQQHNGSSNESLLVKSCTQKDPRERQKKLMEREQALKKKEAMLQAQAEAKRKMNEEKQLKAQQQRKMLEAEKLKYLEMQKQKEEKLKKREQEREEFLQMQKQEQEKKRQAQKKKYKEIQAQKLQLMLQQEQAKNRPVYMITQPPNLPTDDCYDSDDPGYKKVAPPSWCSGDLSKITQLSILAAGEKIKNTLFCRHAQTPDLTEIFETIDPKKLKRTSSRLWKKPPRYTMMPDLNETKFSDDEELYDSN